MKRAPTDSRITLVKARAIEWRYPQDRESEWRERIAPHAPSRAVFQALSLLRQAGVEPYADLGVRLAARLDSKPLPWLREWAVRRALRRVSSWVANERGRLKCAPAYLEGRARLHDHVEPVTEVVLGEFRRPERATALLGSAFSLAESLWRLPTGDRERNLRLALRCWQAIASRFERASAPETWAAAQNRIGAGYSDLPRGERADNLEQAIAAYQAALTVYTREAFPMEWATTQNNLGTAYADRLRGERADNLEQAAACHRAALEVYVGPDWVDRRVQTLVALGGVLSRLEQHAKAAEVFTECIQAEPRQAMHYRNRADEWIQLGRLEDAEKDLATAAGLDVDHKAPSKN